MTLDDIIRLCVLDVLTVGTEARPLTKADQLDAMIENRIHAWLNWPGKAQHT